MLKSIGIDTDLAGWQVAEILDSSFHTELHSDIGEHPTRKILLLDITLTFCILFCAIFLNDNNAKINVRSP